MKKELITLRVNGRTHELAVEPSKLLLDVLREDLRLTGSKRGCDDSSCGACTVQLDGVPMLACTLLAALALAVALAFAAIAFPARIFHPFRSAARTLADHLSLGGIRSRAPPLFA